MSARLTATVGHCRTPVGQDPPGTNPARPGGAAPTLGILARMAARGGVGASPEH